MKITVLEPTGDAFKVLYQDETALKGFVIGISGTLGRNLSDEGKKAYLYQVAERLVKSYGFEKLHDKEKIYTSVDTNIDDALAVNEMVRNFPHSATK